MLVLITHWWLVTYCNGRNYAPWLTITNWEQHNYFVIIISRPVWTLQLWLLMTQHCPLTLIQALSIADRTGSRYFDNQNFSSIWGLELNVGSHSIYLIISCMNSHWLFGSADRVQCLPAAHTHTNILLKPLCLHYCTYIKLLIRTTILLCCAPW